MRLLLLAALCAAPLACGGDPTPTGPADAGPNLCDQVPSGRGMLPRDEAAHMEPTEWWYWTGHLQAADGRWFGFESAFFVQEGGGSTYHMVHHAITDVSADTFNYEQQFIVAPRPATTDGFDLAVGAHTARGANGRDVLHGEVNGYTLDVTLEARKPPVFQHGDGYTDYAIGGYTYYYSRERMTATGTLLTPTGPVEVTGAGWFDHQWGPLNDIVSTGWDWFAIQLDDDREIMLFIAHGPSGPLLVGGSMTNAGCVTREVGAGDFEVASHRTWTSPATGCTYPLGWTVRVFDETYEIAPVMDAQELDTAFIDYWEGAATVSGAANGRAYIELTGYCTVP